MAVQPIDSLVSLGLTVLEAEIYAHLTRHRDQTGYAVAKALGRPTANVYKAIESLEAKGAVVVDDGKQRVCKAVPAEDFLLQLERAFQRHREAAGDALKRLPDPATDERIYQLRSRDQVYERARRMLADTQRIAVLDLFPLPLAELLPDLRVAAERDALLVVKTYEETEIANVDVVVEPEPEWVQQRWPCQWLNVIADGSQFLLAVFTRDGKDVAQAVWSESPYLSWIEYNGLLCELAYTKLKAAIITGDLQRILEAYQQSRRLFFQNAPGYARLVGHLAPRTADNSTGG